MIPLDTKILIVDDAKTMRRIVLSYLTKLGLTKVHEADDGETAWDAIQKAQESKDPFKLIISDWNMPKMKGIDLLAKVRSDLNMKSTPFILLTAESEVDQVSKAAHLGVSGYITKPFNAKTLGEKLEKLNIAA